jgi:hypothetical protein
VIFVDDCEIAVDLRFLNRELAMRRQLRRAASLTVQLGDEIHVVMLVRRPASFGGHRVYVMCPSCQGAVGVLREAPLGDHRLACKACLAKLGARYRSQGRVS